MPISVHTLAADLVLTVGLLLTTSAGPFAAQQHALDRGDRIRPPATDGLRNITGQVNRHGTVTIWAITSTVSGNGDQGADPHKLVAVIDRIGATTPGHESFTTLRTAAYGEVLRGVSLTPGSDREQERDRDETHDRRTTHDR